MGCGERWPDAAGGGPPMAGLLRLATRFAERGLHLGYRAAALLSAGPLGSAGACFRGHEFHYATTVFAGDAAPLFGLTDASGKDLGAGGLRHCSVEGSFLHPVDRAEDWSRPPGPRATRGRSSGVT